MSDSVIVVNADGPETRVALIESGILSEFYVEREREPDFVAGGKWMPKETQYL